MTKFIEHQAQEVVTYSFHMTPRDVHMVGAFVIYYTVGLHFVTQMGYHQAHMHVFHTENC
jgi:hypothetical protein